MLCRKIREWSNDLSAVLQKTKANCDLYYTFVSNIIVHLCCYICNNFDTIKCDSSSNMPLNWSTTKNTIFCCILLFSHVENLLHFNAVEFTDHMPHSCRDFSISHSVQAELNLVKLMVMGNGKNSWVFNFVNLLKLWEFDAREIYVFYSTSRHVYKWR